MMGEGEGKVEWGEVEGIGRIISESRFDLGWWTRNTVNRWCFTELSTWNWYDFVNQCHMNKVNKKEKKKKVNYHRLFETRSHHCSWNPDLGKCYCFNHHHRATIGSHPQNWKLASPATANPLFCQNLLVHSRWSLWIL